MAGRSLAVILTVMLTKRGARIDNALPRLAAYRCHALLIGRERAIAKVRIRDGTGAVGIVARHAGSSGNDDQESGKGKE